MPDRKSEAIKLGGEALCQCIAEHGFTATVDFIIRLNKADWMLEMLLLMSPGISSMGEFLKKLPSFKCEDIEVFENLIKNRTVL